MFAVCPTPKLLEIVVFWKLSSTQSQNVFVTITGSWLQIFSHFRASLSSCPPVLSRNWSFSVATIYPLVSSCIRPLFAMLLAFSYCLFCASASRYHTHETQLRDSVWNWCTPVTSALFFKKTLGGLFTFSRMWSTNIELVFLSWLVRATMFFSYKPSAHCLADDISSSALLLRAVILRFFSVSVNFR